MILGLVGKIQIFPLAFFASRSMILDQRKSGECTALMGVQGLRKTGQYVPTNIHVFTSMLGESLYPVIH